MTIMTHMTYLTANISYDLFDSYDPATSLFSTIFAP